MNRVQRKEARLLLEKLLKMELERLRQRFRPYKRRSFLRNKVTMRIQKGEKGVLGYYKNDRNTDRQFKYTHKISITEYQIEKYYRYYKFSMKIQAMSELRDTIRHELIHAFVFEEFEEWETIKNTYADYSPIFLSCLYFANTSSGHKFTNKYFDTELFQKVKECKNYDSLQTLLIFYIYEFEKVVNKINKGEDQYNINKLSIVFNGSRHGAGMRKRSYIKAYTKYKENNILKQGVIQLITLGIGFLVSPTILLKNCERKFDNGAIAESHIEEVMYANKERGDFRKPVVIFEK